MAMTLTQQKDAYQFFIIAFGAAPGTVYMDQLNDAYAAGMTTKQIVNVYTTKPQFTSLYPNFLTNAEFATSLVNNVVKSSASSAAKAEAIADIQGALASGMTRGDVIFQVFSNLSKLPTTDAKWGGTVTLFNNQVNVAEYYTETLLGNATDIATLRAAVSGVTQTSDTSTPAAMAAIVAGPAPAAVSFTVGQDNIAGNAGNNLFEAAVVQNSLGAQVNTLGSGDRLDGGAGADTLYAKVTAGAFINPAVSFQNTTTMPIQPETRSVETIKLQAVNSAIAGSNINNENGAASTNVYINAKNLLDVTKISSDNSDANLTIQNMTTLNGDGSRHALKDVTIGMAFTGNSDSAWNESDLSVYFDQDYITPQVSSATSVDIRLMNQDAYDNSVSSGGNGLSSALGVAGSTASIGATFISDLKITLNGKPYDLGTYLTRELSPGNSLLTYADALAAVQSAIVKLKAANPTDAALQTLTASIISGNTFTADAPVDSTTGNVSGVARVGQAITMSVSGGATINTLVVNTLLLSPVNQSNTNSNLFNRSQTFVPTTDSNLAINVDLTKVGNWGDGGSLVIGSMFKDGQNEWSSLYKGKGINEFDVTVYGTQVANGDDQSSSLKQLASTGNNLKIVKVVSDALVTKDFADLTIGNSQTENSGGLTSLAKGDAPSIDNANALKDVQTFDASTFKGDLTLFAALTDEVTAKYLNVVDGSPAAPGADNVKFTYSAGSGNDYINLSLDSTNLAKPGTATREDMTLTVNGGTGNDEIVVKIAEVESGRDNGGEFARSVPSSFNWYGNQHINADLALVGAVATGQLQLNGGDGNDTIRKLGAGDFALNGGTGNDTIYTENTGSGGFRNYFGPEFNSGRGSVAFNAQTSNPRDLLSQDRELTVVGTVPAKVNVTVNFLGFEKTIEVTSTSVVGGQSITDLMINQAIKTAVNSDPVLQKLAIAEDGPGHTLVLRSLIDGNLNIDPATGLAHPLTAGDQIGNYTISLAPASTSAVTVSQLDTAFGTVNGRYSNSNWMTQGADSNSPSDNLIVGGTGNDVIVLGTAGYHRNGNEFFGSNDTVAYEGVYGLGDDTIVNFDTTMTPAGTPVAVLRPAARETVVLTFSASDGSPTGQTITFSDATSTTPSPSTINLSTTSVQGVIPGIDVAFQFDAQFSSTNWTASHVVGTNTVTLTYAANAPITDVTAANFTGTYFGATNGNGTVGVATTVQGATAGSVGSPSVFTVSYSDTGTAAAAAGAFTFDGATVSYAQGDGSISLAQKANGATYANWTTVNNNDGSVTFTAKANGVTPIGTATDFDTASNNIAGTITGGPGVADIGVTYLISPGGPGMGFDYLDFTAYAATNVVVVDNIGAGDLTVGALGAGGNYILLTEKTGAANAGKYDITHMNSVDATVGGDTLVGTVGTTDFGHSMIFNAANFIV